MPAKSSLTPLDIRFTFAKFCLFKNNHSLRFFKYLREKKYCEIISARFPYTENNGVDLVGTRFTPNFTPKNQTTILFFLSVISRSSLPD